MGGAVSWARSFPSSRKEAANPAADRAWPDNESTSAPFNTSGTRYRIRSSDFSRSGEASESTAHTQQHEAKMTWLARRPVQRQYNINKWRNSSKVIQALSLPGLDRGITRGNCFLQGRSGLVVEITTHHVSFYSKTQQYTSYLCLCCNDFIDRYLMTSLQRGRKGCFW